MLLLLSRVQTATHFPANDLDMKLVEGEPDWEEIQKTCDTCDQWRQTQDNNWLQESEAYQLLHVVCD